MRNPGRCDGVLLLASLLLHDLRIADLLEQGQRWIDDSGTGGVFAAGQFFYRLDDFVPVAGPVLQQIQDHQLEVAVFEQAFPPAPTLETTHDFRGVSAVVRTMAASAATPMISKHCQTLSVAELN